MKYAAIALLALVGAGIFSQPAQAQNYYYQERIVGGRRVMVPVSGYQNVPGSYLDGSMSGSARMPQPGTTPGYLPPTIHSPYVGQPGDGVSRGNFNGNNVGLAVPAAGGLPPCRSSIYMDGYGDHVRSDMNRNINGTVRQQPRRVAPRQTVPASTEVWSYGKK